MTSSSTPSNTPSTPVVANKQKIRDLWKYADHLSAWESNFLRSIESFLDRGHELSQKQQGVLDKMVAKAAERFD